jgi:hypothetical protein
MKIIDINIKPYQGAGTKRFTAIIKYNIGDIQKTKTVNFGLDTGNTYYDGATEQTRKAYIARHSKSPGEDWSNPLTAGFWSRYMLWEVRQNKVLSYIKSKFPGAKVTINV